MNVPVQRALKDYGYAELARAIQTTRQAVFFWAQTGTIPPKKVLKVAPLIGMEPHEIRPDIYPAPSGEAAAE